MTTDIKPETTELAEALGKTLSLDVKTGTASSVGTFVIDNLPPSNTKESVEDLQKYYTTLAAAAPLALGKLVIPAMKKNKELDNVKLSIPMVGKDTLNVSFNRSINVPSKNPDGTAGTEPKFGTFKVGIDMYSEKSRGDLVKVKAMLSAQATASFGNLGK